MEEPSETRPNRRSAEKQTRRVDERIESGRMETPTRQHHCGGQVALTVKGDVVVYREDGDVTLVR